MTDPRILCLVAAAGVLALSLSPAPLFADSYYQTNLVSDVPGLAPTTDPNLVNPWGVSFSATSPFWVSDQGTNLSTVYNGLGAITPLVVPIPAGGPPSGPTGQVFNGTTSFTVGGVATNFIFDTLQGTIAARTTGTTVTTVATTPGAVYTGLAIGSVGADNYLYAANSLGNIQVFNGSFANVTGTAFAGKFVDSSIPAGYVPFNVQLIGSDLYVTYAELAGPVAAPGSTGYVDEYDTSGNLLKRIASGGALDAPWGITLAPSGFGSFSNDLLIGNFGNGTINAYSTAGGGFLGTITDGNGVPIANDFLWDLSFRTDGASSTSPDALYLTAGIDNQTAGLFAEIQLTPEPAPLVLVGLGLIAFALIRLRAQPA